MAAGCCCPPESKQKTPKGPQFDADFYSKNAKEYIDQGHYGQAKDQWQKQLVKDPGNWMAQHGHRVLRLLPLRRVRRRPPQPRRGALASEGRREGIQGDPVGTSSSPTPSRWTRSGRSGSAELGLALTMRAMGALDHLDAQRNLEMAKRGGPEASKMADQAAELQIERDRNYQDAVARFQSLAYMKHASPEAIKNLGELYVVTKQDALAEQEYRRYLEIAATSYEQDVGGQEEGCRAVRAGRGRRRQPALGPEARLERAQAGVGHGGPGAARLGATGLHGSAPASPGGDQDPARQKDLYLRLGETEAKLDMLETAIINLDEYLKRSSKNREEFNDDVRHAMKLKAELQQKLKERGGK